MAFSVYNSDLQTGSKCINSDTECFLTFAMNGYNNLDRNIYITCHSTDLWCFMVFNNNYVFYKLTNFALIRIITQSATNGQCYIGMFIYIYYQNNYISVSSQIGQFFKY